MNVLRNVLIAIAVAILPRPVFAEGPKQSPVGMRFFETKIRPVLVDHCYSCHSVDADEVGGKLLLDSRDGMLKGGEAGAALVAGKPEASLILQAIQYDGLQMPPEQQLPETVINDFITWIENGAPDPRTGESSRTRNASAKAAVQDGDEALWSYRPVQDPIVPDVGLVDWPRDPIDHFVLARLEAVGAEPTRDATAEVLARRLFIDLIGLSPTYDQVQRFAAACEADRTKAVAQLVDQLLSTRHFGERWGRHWLDVARYGESNGNDGLGRNPTFPHAWRYRDYVIDAFNDDVPYDRFLTEQLAGDLLPAETPADRDRHLIATGFLAMAAKPAKAMNNDFAMDVVADQIDVVGTGIMGISVACARCHDHKFDPIPTRDYYALAGIFASSETMWGVAANEKLTAPATDLHVLKAAPRNPPPKDFVETVLVLESNTGKPKAIPKPPWPVGTPLAMGVRDVEKPADCKINIKGDSKKLGEPVPRGFLTACKLESSPDLVINPKQSGRLELARWLTRGDHPQTARVYVNRVWQHLFGTGIVSTPDDFGVYGERPTHPELLDHLANRFVRDGWSIKKLIRSIVLSRTYQLSSRAPDATIERDPGATLLSHHQRRRLDAEVLRDSMLQASGQLELEPAQGSLVQHRDILVNLAGNLHQPNRHRSVYLCYLRSSPPPSLAAFDLPEFTKVTGRRDISTVPGQALHLFNSPFVVSQAEAFAKTVLATRDSDQDRIRAAWQRAFGRVPTADEQQQATAFLRSAKEDLGKPKAAWTSLCQALLMTNEFRYVD
jgi:hypothetical protein